MEKKDPQVSSSSPGAASNEEVLLASVSQGTGNASSAAGDVVNQVSVSKEEGEQGVSSVGLLTQREKFAAEAKEKAAHSMAGHAGAAFLRQELGRAHPVKVITDFQANTQLQECTLPATSLLAFQLLDLHKVRRSTVHEALLKKLRSLLLSEIHRLAQEQLESQRAELRKKISERRALSAKSSSKSSYAQASSTSRGGLIRFGEGLHSRRSGSSGGQSNPQTGVVGGATAKELSQLRNLVPQPSQEVLELLTLSFPYLSFAELREIPLTIMAKFRVPKSFLIGLANNELLYQDSPLALKQRIWEIDDQLFGKEILPLMEQFCQDYDAQNDLAPAMHTHIIPMAKKFRYREDERIKKIAEMIGDSNELYEFALHFIRMQFIKTQKIGYCILRMELVLAMRDYGKDVLFTLDGCHDIAQCMDVCFRDGLISKLRVSEIGRRINELEVERKYVVGDCAMILANPRVIDMISVSFYTLLKEAIAQFVLPNKSEDLQALSIALQLAYRAKTMVAQDLSTLPLPDESRILSASITALCTFITHARILNEMAAQPDRKVSFTSTPLHISPSLGNILSSNPLIWQIYVLDCIGGDKSWIVTLCLNYLQEQCQLLMSGDISFFDALIACVQKIKDHNMQSMVRRLLELYGSHHPVLSERLQSHLHLS